MATKSSEKSSGKKGQIKYPYYKITYADGTSVEVHGKFTSGAIQQETPTGYIMHFLAGVRTLEKVERPKAEKRKSEPIPKV